MQEPLVSILIPFKNTAEYLPECLESIMQQSYQNWEVLAINDHSTDNSLSVVNDFNKKDARINCYSNDGKGIIAALRKAFSKSQGKFVTRMDSDDIMTHNKLQVLVTALLEKGKGHIAIGQVKYFSSSGISNGYARYESWLNNLTQNGTNYTEIYKECVIPSPCWMTYRNDREACNAFVPDRYPEDYDLTFRFYENGLKCIPGNELLHYWRDYDTRTSRTSAHYAKNYFLDIKIHYFLKLEYHDTRPLVVWGAGNKGKEIAKILLERKLDFHWVCDNPKKIGKDIYGKKMLKYSALQKLKNPKSIVTVANEDEQEIIKDFFTSIDQTHGNDYFFFC